MVVNRLQKALINSHIAPKSFKAKLSKYFFSNTNTYFFLTILVQIFIVKRIMFTSIHLHTKNTKKKLKNATIVYA
jgi:hypothetical protein